MIKRHKRLAIAVVIIAGAAALAAIAVHTLLQGSVLASVDVGPGYVPVSLAVDAGTGAVLSSQGAMALRGGQVAVDAVSHHVFVGGPHYGRGTALALVSSFVNRAIYPVVHREFWVTGSGAATWAVSTVQGTR